MNASDHFTQAEEAAKFIASKSPIKPLVCHVLGSGSAALADEMTTRPISYSQIPHFVSSTAAATCRSVGAGKYGAWPVVGHAGPVSSI